MLEAPITTKAGICTRDFNRTGNESRITTHPLTRKNTHNFAERIGEQISNHSSFIFFRNYLLSVDSFRGQTAHLVFRGYKNGRFEWSKIHYTCEKLGHDSREFGHINKGGLDDAARKNYSSTQYKVYARRCVIRYGMTHPHPWALI